MYMHVCVYVYIYIYTHTCRARYCTRKVGFDYKICPQPQRVLTLTAIGVTISVLQRRRFHVAVKDVAMLQLKTHVVFCS